MKERNYADLKSFAAEMGADLLGVAETARIERYIDDEIKSETARLPYVVSVGIRLQKSVLNTLIDRPNQIYKTHYRQVNAALDQLTHDLARYIQNKGFNALPVAASFILDWQKQNAHVSHKHAALAAGMGFLGRNNLLVHPQYGAAVRLSSVFTDMPLSVDQPIPNDCGECLACMAACPADAIDLDHFDFDKCYAQIKEFSHHNNYNLLICGLCVKACLERVQSDGDARG
jgi:epoxyqueuosine reductase QueG